MNKEDSTRKTSTGMHLCFSPLSRKIVLARMRESKGRLRRVGNDRGRDVTNEAARLVWEVVRAEGGKIWWEDGTFLVLRAEILKTDEKENA
ncbi:hypothetical protein KED40_004845 [Escherichia coli]|nr:hypothetical protein [Escherichia coli]EHO7055015.1 hypothetical protein [Escherichia coli]HBC0657708.1 hypothetical protein [Escherichia coli]